jgi:hypothetical protein
VCLLGGAVLLHVLLGTLEDVLAGHLPFVCVCAIRVASDAIGICVCL